MAEPLLALLRASLAEQTPVTLHLSAGRVDGVVAHLDDETVELRGGVTRTIVLLARIDAVTSA
jgi:hypothetical protein